jgi:hypothetical protein
MKKAPSPLRKRNAKKKEKPRMKEQEEQHHEQEVQQQQQQQHEQEQPEEEDLSYRREPWRDDFGAPQREREREAKKQRAREAKPNVHIREMKREEHEQREVVRKKLLREQASLWLFERVKDGRRELLDRSRTVFIHREAQLLWTKKSVTIHSKMLRAQLM